MRPLVCDIIRMVLCSHRRGHGFFSFSSSLLSPLFSHSLCLYLFGRDGGYKHGFGLLRRYDMTHLAALYDINIIRGMAGATEGSIS